MKIAFFLFMLLVFSWIGASELKYSIKLLGTEVGEMSEQFEKIELEKCKYRVTTLLKTTITRGNSRLDNRTESVSEVECGTFIPLSFHSVSSNNGSKVIYHAKKEGEKFKGYIEKNGLKEIRELKIESGLSLFGMIFKKYPAEFFLKKGSIKAISEESFVIKKINYEGFRKGRYIFVNLDYDGIPINVVLEGSKIVRLSIKAGLMEYELKGHTGLPESLKKEAKGKDILKMSSLSNSGIGVKRPRRSKKMSFMIEGAVKDIPELCYQRADKTAAGVFVTVDINKTGCLEKGTDKKYIEGNIYEDKDSPGVTKVADKWRHKKRGTAIKKSIDFVYDYIADKNYSYGNLSASEVLEKKAGDCTEHSTLLSALLKNQGIPTRMVYGLILNSDNNFYFHNWNEVYFGKKWIPVDSTVNGYPADASRIALIFGGNTSADREKVALQVLHFIQGIKISVTGYKSD